MKLRIWENEVHFVIAESAADALDILRDTVGCSEADWDEDAIADHGGEFWVYDRPTFTLNYQDDHGGIVTHPPSVWCEIEGPCYLGSTEY